MLYKPITLKLIVGNRGFFPSHQYEDGRNIILKVLEEEGINAVEISPGETPSGSLESIEAARKQADPLTTHKNEIDAVLVILPNYGNERANANTLRRSGLEVPVLFQAFPDNAKKQAHQRPA